MQAFTIQAGILQLVTFRLGDEKYAVDILKVQEINNLKEITKIPNAPDYLEGAINLRGRVIPVLNLRRRFGLDEKAMDEATKIVVMDVKGVIMGILVDGVSEVLRVSEDIVEPPPRALNGSAEFITGVAKLEEGLVLLLDMDRLLSAEEQVAVFGAAKE